MSIIHSFDPDFDAILNLRDAITFEVKLCF